MSSFPRNLIPRIVATLAIVTASVGSIATAQSEGSANSDALSQGKEAVATLAGGCFWCTEAVFENMEGVNDVVSGYIGGQVPNPTYEQVCGKLTGHAEAVEVYYDPTKVTYEEILKVFFKTHDPTTLNKQGADEGPQYRSSIFIHSAEQKQIAERVIKELTDAHEYRKPIVTQLEVATEFYPAEEYHQDYYRRNPTAGYCRAVVATKVKKFKNVFPEKVKQE
ncbi:Peptide methionine sulfoxide reductase MsrA 2 [Rubripirellula amarantea]|uniref:Peptide methionine sulfoxide reductase MsrA n=1 Tax=Rubripirellula amarantea TaxID=2527999 RepID=A0A5C5WKY0_9BACT|nr:peptide-methionine (S)-S-oxide reductase MsrA [Rubripirellula amarantea]TWT50623.1 Peptide methionine sulfoxide reductase MsrA 2 [Rubripirellula amarantea]